jgi:hypothetical protein
MRRAAQFQFEIGEKGELKQPAVDNAIEEMVFSGGTLNQKLLGGRSTDLSSASENQICHHGNIRPGTRIPYHKLNSARQFE